MRARGWLVGGLLGGGIFQAANAVDAPHRPVPDAAQVARVLLILTPSNVMYRAPLRYEGLLKIGCRFGTSFDPERQAELVDIMRRYLVHSPADGGFNMAFLRNAIELHMVDGSVLRYTFSDEYYRPGRSVYGWRDHKAAEGAVQSGTLPVVAQGGFLRELRTWAAGDVGRINFNPECLREPPSSDAEEIKRALPGPLR